MHAVHMHGFRLGESLRRSQSGGDSHCGDKLAAFHGDSPFKAFKRLRRLANIPRIPKFVVGVDVQAQIACAHKLQ